MNSAAADQNDNQASNCVHLMITLYQQVIKFCQGLIVANNIMSFFILEYICLLACCCC
jgi:hypothetical protein